MRHTMTDMEFEKVRELVLFVEVNTTAATEHVGLIQSKIKHIKEVWYGAAFSINVFPVHSKNFDFSP